MTRGAAKIYRSSCFIDIGQAYLSRGWDTMDNYAAQSHGWETKKTDIYFKHNKLEGKKSGVVKLRYWTGLFNGRVPYYFPYFILKIIYYLFSQPIFIGSFIELIGYFFGISERKKQFPDHVCKYVRKYQKEKIINSIFKKR